MNFKTPDINRRRFLAGTVTLPFLAGTTAVPLLGQGARGATPGSITLSFTPTAGMNATETRMFCAHSPTPGAPKSLYAANGQWNAPTSENGPQIIRQDYANGPWNVEHTFPMSNIVCNCLAELNFPSVGVSMLATGSWWGGIDVMVAPHNWVHVSLHGGDARCFTSYTESNGTEWVFVGMNQGVFSGVYSLNQPSKILWNTIPEITPNGYLGLDRIMAFAKINGVLYCSIGEQVYQRNNTTRSWNVLWTNPNPGVTNNALGGLRGMTPITAPNNGTPLPPNLTPGATTLWMMNCSTTAPAIISLDPTTVTAKTLFTPYSGIIAYNKFCVVPMKDGSLCVLAGQAGGVNGPAHIVRLLQGAWTQYIPLPALAPQNMISTRTITLSPFNTTEIYLGGHDNDNIK